jgi:class 3 adenylate cyclase
MRREITFLQRFSLLTLGATAALGLALGLQITASIETTAVERARHDLAETIRARRPFWMESPDLKGEFKRLRNDWEEYNAWKESVDYMLLGYAIYRVKIWNSEGQIIWSDEPSIIGEMHDDNHELEEALEGNVVSELADLGKEENSTDGVEGRVLELYVPILPKESFDVVGVFEVYQEISEVDEAISVAQMEAWTLISVMMVAFYLALFAFMADASRTLSRLQRVAQLERYFSPAVAQAIASLGGGVIRRVRGGTTGALTSRVEATVMFTDIRGFTRHTEQMEPEDVVAMLSDYLDLVTSAVFKHGGSVDKFLGDGVLAVFGAPMGTEGHAANALYAAEEIRWNLTLLNQSRQEEGEPSIQIGTALATGEVITGTVGRGAQVTYTVVGDAVNLASRLVGMARPGEVLITNKTCEGANIADELAGMQFNGPFTLQVRGRTEPVTIYVSADPAIHDAADESGFTVRHLRTPVPSLAR